MPVIFEIFNEYAVCLPQLKLLGVTCCLHNYKLRGPCKQSLYDTTHVRDIASEQNAS